jgi:hypothetical protein
MSLPVSIASVETTVYKTIKNRPVFMKTKKTGPDRFCRFIKNTTGKQQKFVDPD